MKLRIFVISWWTTRFCEVFKCLRVRKCCSVENFNVGPCRQFLFGFGVMFTSLLDLYRASRCCHGVLDELIPEVLLSILKSCINTKLQNRHARMNLLYQWGYYQWIKYKIHANTEGKLMARLTEIHRQHLPMLKPCTPSSKPSMDIIVALHWLNLALDHTHENIILSKILLC
jgi:hypothetical protein